MNKLRLFENTYNKLASDKAFMAYYLEQLCLRESKTKDDIIALLNCSFEDFYKLALCKAPEITTPDFKERITKIADYTNTSALILTNIIDPAFSKNNVSTKKITVLSKIKNDIRQLFPIPQWLTRSKQIVYQTVISFCLVITFIFILDPSPKNIKTTQLFMIDYFGYTDSTKHIHLQDNTFVSKNKL